MLRQALAERQTQHLLFDALEAALQAGEAVTASLPTVPISRAEDPLPALVMDRLKKGLQATAGAPVDAEETLRLVEAIRVLAVRHGPAAVDHCIRLIENLRELLDKMSGTP